MEGGESNKPPLNIQSKGRSASNIDMTQGNINLIERVSQWKVEGCITANDHNLIQMSVRVEGVTHINCSNIK